MPVTPILHMALPAVKALQDCADFEQTVAPFIPQLYDLPKRLLAIKSVDALQQVYTSTNPVISAFAFSLVIAALAFVVSEINRNYSQIDRLWSILPALYNVHYWYWAKLIGIRSARLDAVALFSVCWSARLTFNYWRKGGYQKGSEDYRWAIIKKHVNEPIWLIFNITFIATIQSILLAAVATPTYIMVLTSRIDPAISIADKIFPQALGLLLIIEFFADNQQWRFQNAKKDYQKTAKAPEGYTARELDRGFIASGLWQYSRHPNFAAEQTIWVALYQWACFDTSSLMNWTFCGALTYLLIFQGSTPITEWISKGKYPEYKEYQARVGRFIPSIASLGVWDKYVQEQERQGTNGTPAGKQGKKNK
ncbi:hypothetical protein CAC42_3903 [Sphaceloma murrayae]|uniref:Steroid 5-alpha reductase C-terminal domain-containing protein n=1 Tax=Sphaceloma murrayae TaxID=2082308 RepID=A0A2K1QS95_9PEZI|nr:hypothetical protein CAC42_3903 [Sphaceloma murrayae]